MFCLYVEAGDQGPAVYVGPQSPATICNRVREEGGCPV